MRSVRHAQRTTCRSVVGSTRHNVKVGIKTQSDNPSAAILQIQASQSRSRRVAKKHGVQYAMEAAGHTNSQYNWRYMQPTDDEKEKAIDELF